VGTCTHHVLTKHRLFRPPRFSQQLLVFDRLLTAPSMLFVFVMEFEGQQMAANGSQRGVVAAPAKNSVDFILQSYPVPVLPSNALLQKPTASSSSARESIKHQIRLSTFPSKKNFLLTGCCTPEWRVES